MGAESTSRTLAWGVSSFPFSMIEIEEGGRERSEGCGRVMGGGGRQVEELASATAGRLN